MNYSYKMPELEDLMQVWPETMETAFASLPLPTAELDLTLEEYSRIICALLDIPVKGNLVESLHLLFTLYQQFRENNYFTQVSRGSTPSHLRQSLQ
jgi:intraflagellar transport protein 46